MAALTLADRFAYVLRAWEAKARYAKEAPNRPTARMITKTCCDVPIVLGAESVRARGTSISNRLAPLSQVEEHKGRLYVCLRNGGGFLRAYRVSNDGRLKALSRPPAALKAA